MKIEVCCPKCNRGYLVDEAVAGGQLCCLDCATAIDVARSAAPAEPAPAGGVAPGEEIVCPRCKLHFMPKRGVAPSPAENRPRVLVVEDMEYFRELATEALGGHCEVLTASHVADAVEILARGGIDLLVLDLTLDGGDHGFALLSGLGSKPCPILVFTAKDESEMYGDTWERLQQLGADDIVTKNMQAGELLARKAGELLGLSFAED